ncbi:phytanoyl-CoA dioxygenase family protein [Caballeronia sp. LZ043]|uniref:phytanoyl-CoA dioxygenase family protein n=1 Tax=Caballeronia sp. LZ043 TaxID=3038569 RepID=UPI002856CA6F|nr:phytanoyl-CoA dioxygenase family protein [Caballeronia sp. LZ043]MDR5823596.1 phytanoyl-CoA dioxygenase family protein [Caballeronia sp. LZ043]
MDHHVEGHRVDQPNWYRQGDCRLEDFIALLETNEAHKPRYAADIVQRIPVYECRDLQRVLISPGERPRLLAEWANVLQDGAGVFVLKHAFTNTQCVDDATVVFESIIEAEKRLGARADHFAKAGANDRIWNAQEKLCLSAPATFIEYFSNPMLSAAAEAWLGPFFQVTSQVNAVRPGAEAQQAHRDYHLGFQSAEVAASFPPHVHRMSAFLTLQGAVAHSDMPVESGPTKLLPYSQQYAEGYVAWQREDFRTYFEAHFVQLPLEKGDAVFFSPALFHAAGANRTGHVQRIANLLQISSVYGRAMEVVDRTRMSETVYPVLRSRLQAGRITDCEVQSVIASCAEAYAFPTNLDRDPPVEGMAPESQGQLMFRALREDWTPVDFSSALKAHACRRRTCQAVP